MIDDFIVTGLLYGLLLSFISLAVILPFRILNFPDLTSDGSYPLGGAVTVIFLLNGFNPVISILLAAFFAGLVGIGTACLSIKLKINSLLSGIIISTMLYSVNLRVMSRPNIPIFDIDTIFDYSNIWIKISIVAIALLSISILLFLFLRTEVGLRMRSVGFNARFSMSQGISVDYYKYLGLFIANALAGISGGIIVQLQKYVDIGMGVGIAVHGLASMMIGESIFGSDTILKMILSAVIGALIYQQIQGMAMIIGFSQTDLKLLTGCIIILILFFRKGSNHERSL